MNMSHLHAKHKRNSMRIHSRGGSLLAGVSNKKKCNTCKISRNLGGWVEDYPVRQVEGTQGEFE